MGRGRAKAKQTKVARELKYSSPRTDFDRLQRELSGTDPADAVDAWDATESWDNGESLNDSVNDSFDDEDSWRR